MSGTVVVVGANSGIARALCRRLAARGCPLVLAARDCDEAQAQAADLRIRHGQPVVVEPFDALAFDGLPEFVMRCLRHGDGDLAGVVVCHGYLGPDEPGQPVAAAAEVRRTIDVNFTSAVLVLESFAAVFERRRSGSIVAITSVAGDRGRQSNYLYGAAKGGLTVYLQGLRNRLHRAGVHVLTVKPGFVATAMTAGKIDPRSPLLASPERVARDIDRALLQRRDVLYTPWFWWGIMAVIKAIPEGVFKRLRL
jgi:NAD(P)-dependent dehydrogenase (short-subunit alcohol dehydrogenase family)